MKKLIIASILAAASVSAFANPTITVGGNLYSGHNSSQASSGTTAGSESLAVSAGNGSAYTTGFGVAQQSTYSYGATRRVQSQTGQIIAGSATTGAQTVTAGSALGGSGAQAGAEGVGSAKAKHKSIGFGVYLDAPTLVGPSY